MTADRSAEIAAAEATLAAAQADVDRLRALLADEQRAASPPSRQGRDWRLGTTVLRTPSRALLPRLPTWDADPARGGSETRRRAEARRECERPRGPMV